MYDLHSEFDIKEHAKHYVNYLEVIIRPSGKVEYAIPSHQEKLIKIGMDKHNCSREDYQSMCPREYWLDYMTWLTKDTKCVSVWTDYFAGTPNRFQRKKLEDLKRAGIYLGETT